MFKNKVQRYSIRKLTVGAASVLIGMAFLTNSNQAKADTVNDNQNSNDNGTPVDDSHVAVSETPVQNIDHVEVQAAANDQATENPNVTAPATKASAKTVSSDETAAKADTKDQVATDTLNVKQEKTENTDQKADALTESKAAVDTNKQENTDSTKDKKFYNATITMWDDVNNKPVRWFQNGQWKNAVIKATNNDNGLVSNSIKGVNLIYNIPGYKITTNIDEAIKDDFKIENGMLMFNGKDANLTLHYAPLSDLKIEYVNEENGNVIASSEIPTWRLTTESYGRLHGDLTAPDASKYEATAIDIPGYELVSNPVIEGKIEGQTQKKDDPNYVKIIFKYKKVMTNEDSVTTTSGKNSWGAKADGGWSSLPGMFQIKGLAGLKNNEDGNGDVEKKTQDLIDKYEKQGFTYVGMGGKAYNNDYYNFLSYGSDLYLIPNKAVTVNYVDEQGNKLADSDNIEFNKDNPNQANNGIDPTNHWFAKGTWETKPKDIDGYYLVNVKGAEKGKFTSYNYITTYVYAKKVSGQVAYIDDTEKKTINTDPLPEAKIGDKIDYTTAQKIQDLLNQGYKLVSNNFTDGNETYQNSNKDKNANNFEIHLVHDYVPVNPKNPGKPGEPINPNDPNGPKYPEGTDAKSIQKTITRTVDYVDENGKSLVDHPASESVTLSANGVLDKVTGEWTTPEGLKWNSANFEAINTPDFPTYHVTGVTSDGDLYYTVDQKTGNVSATPVTHENGDTKVIVHLSRNEVNGTVTYIDDTIGKTLKTDDIGEGKIGSQITYTTQDKINDYLNKGYQLKSTNFVDGKMYYQEDKNNYEVHLVHQLIPIDPKNPGKPGEPINPNDPDPNGPKFPDGTDKGSLTKEITRTVNYVDENGQPVSGSVTQTATMTGAGMLDKVTGEWTTPLAWEDGNFDAINTPSVNGYHVTNVTTDGDLYYTVDDQGNVPSTKVTHEDGNTVVTVHFAKDSIPASGNVTYIDDTTGITLKNDPLKGNVGEKINYTTQDQINSYEDQGYKLVRNDFKDGNETFAKDGNVFEVHFVHDLVPVNPKNPGKPGDPINPKNPDGPKFPDGTDQASLTKDVTRTVNYVDENGNPISNSVTQTVTINGSGVLDKVTGDWTTPLTWEDGNFDAVNTPSIDGYHVNNVTTDGDLYYNVDNNGNVSSTKVSKDNGNTVVTVHFAKNQTPAPQPSNPDVTPTPNPTPNPSNPTNPTQPTETVTPQPETPETPQTPETPSDNEETVTPHATDVPEDNDDNNDTEETVRPHAAAMPEKQVAKKNGAAVVKTAAKAKAQTLPQTGEENDDAAAAAGLAMFSAISLIGLAGLKKRKN